MVTNSTRNLVLSVVDYNQEYTTKLIILFLILIYSIILLWYSYKIVPKNCKKSDIGLKENIVAMFIRVITIPYIFLFILLISFVMFKDYHFNQLMNLIISFYILATLIVLLYLIIFGWQFVLELFNIDSLSGKNRILAKNKLNRRFYRR